MRYLTDDLRVDKSASWGEMQDTRKGVVTAENLTRAWNMNELSSSRNGLFIVLGYIVSRPKKQHHRTGSGDRINFVKVEEPAKDKKGPPSCISGFALLVSG